jgi:hypothetical protein
MPSHSGGRDQEDRGSNQPGQIVHGTLSRKYPSEKGLADWLKVKALSSSPSYIPKGNENTCSHKNLYTSVHSSTDNSRKVEISHVCFKPDDWINKMCYIHTMEHFLALKMNKILIHSTI